MKLIFLKMYWDYNEQRHPTLQNCVFEDKNMLTVITYNRTFIILNCDVKIIVAQFSNISACLTSLVTFFCTFEGWCLILGLNLFVSIEIWSV